MWDLSLFKNNLHSVDSASLCFKIKVMLGQSDKKQLFSDDYLGKPLCDRVAQTEFLDGFLLIVDFLKLELRPNVENNGSSCKWQIFLAGSVDFS